MCQHQKCHSLIRALRNALKACPKGVLEAFDIALALPYIAVTALKGTGRVDGTHHGV